MEKVLIDKGPDYCGRMYGPPFFVARDPGVNLGWFVFGRSPDYGWRTVKVVARPDVKPRVYKHWNGHRARGWWLKREAQAVADQLNEDQ